MVQTVNGYACFSCADVTKAQQGTNPRPIADPQQVQSAAAAAGPAGTAPPPGADPASNQPLTSGPRGTVLNITA